MANRRGMLKMHLDNGGWAACEAPTQRVTSDVDKVTCQECRRCLKWWLKMESLS